MDEVDFFFTVLSTGPVSPQEKLRERRFGRSESDKDGKLSFEDLFVPTSLFLTSLFALNVAITSAHIHSYLKFTIIDSS